MGENRSVLEMGFDWTHWKALFPCIGEVNERTFLLTENGAKGKTIPTSRERIDEREGERGSMKEKERERERAYRLMWEAKRREVCGYWVLFRHKIESTTARLGIGS